MKRRHFLQKSLASSAYVFRSSDPEREVVKLDVSDRLDRHAGLKSAAILVN